MLWRFGRKRQIGAVPKGAALFRTTDRIVRVERRKWPSRLSLEGGLLEEVMRDAEESPFGFYFG